MFETWVVRDQKKIVRWPVPVCHPVEKSQVSCKTTNNPILDHFVDTNKSIPVPKDGEREIEDLLLIGNRRTIGE